MLEIAVTSTSTDDAGVVAESWRSLARVTIECTTDPHPGTTKTDVRVHVIAWPPDFPTSACYQLVVAIDDGVAVPDDHRAIDAWTDIERARDFWRERLLPFRDNLAANRRAPRRQVAELAAPRPTWPSQARLLIARLERVLGHAALRIDHIGSTSVPGLPAKDLIDIQVVVPDLDVADGVAVHAGCRIRSRPRTLDRTGP